MRWMLLVFAAAFVASTASATETVWGQPASQLVEEPNGGLPDGPNFRLNSDYSVMQSPTSYRSSLVLGPGNATSPNYFRAPDLRPTGPHEDLGVLTHTTTDTDDDTGTEICADVTINTFGWGACVEVDDNQDGTFESTCSADLGIGNDVNVRCGAGAVGTEPSYSSIIGGYDNHLNHQASQIISQHSSIGPGDAGGHMSIFGGATHFIEGDCEYSIILGGSNNWIDCLRTDTATSKSNSILGGQNNEIDVDGLTYAFDGSYNTIFSSWNSVISGPSFSSSIVGGVRSIVDMGSLAGSATAGDEGIANLVSGVASSVVAFDIGDGTIRAPSYAKAEGLGGQAWLTGMHCRGNALGSDANEVNLDARDGDRASAQYCTFQLNDFNVAAGGTYETLTLDRGDTEGVIALESGIWAVEGKILCKDRTDPGTGTNSVFKSFSFETLVSCTNCGGGSGTVAFWDNAGSSSTSLVPTVVGLGGPNAIGANQQTYLARVSARNGTASLNAGFDVEVNNTNTAGSDQGPAECNAFIEVNMMSE